MILRSQCLAFPRSEKRGRHPYLLSWTPFLYTHNSFVVYLALYQMLPAYFVEPKLCLVLQLGETHPCLL